MPCVLDTSAAFEIVFKGARCSEYSEMLKSADEVIAPSLFQAEASNVMWKYIRGGYIDEENAKLSLALVLQFVDCYYDAAEFSVESLHEAIRNNHSVYDMLYFTLARRNGATLLTCDEKLRNLAIDNGIKVL